MTTAKCRKIKCPHYAWKSADTGRAYELTEINGSCLLTKRIVHRMTEYPEGCPVKAKETDK
jgi:hypothetical protein